MNSNTNTLRYFLLSLTFISALAIQCKAKQEVSAEETKPVMEKLDTTGPEYTSLYICPMHCQGSGSDHAGVCPSCGMDYVMNESAPAPAQDTTSAK